MKIVRYSSCHDLGLGQVSGKQLESRSQSAEYVVEQRPSIQYT
jgi:hypothetical protein